MDTTRYNQWEGSKNQTINKSKNKIKIVKKNNREK